jgi:hypothetical protein
VELLEWLFERYDTRLVVLNAEERQSETDELRDDLLAVVTFFVARNNGRRSAANRKRRREAQDEGEDLEEETIRNWGKREGNARRESTAHAHHGGKRS